MSARYAALPTHPAPSDAERDRMLDDTFGAEDDNESTPLNHHQPSDEEANVIEYDGEGTTAIPGAYDFERDYDYPPPGSPPAPSAFARPNDIGNSNGRLPSAPAPAPSRRMGFFRRAVGALLPTHYARVPTEPQSSRARGGGLENDGVFANVMAKPQPARVVQTEDGDVRLAPEETQKEGPPSYTEAAADAVPPYWETTVHAPAELAAGEFMVIDDLPSGSFLVFALNMFISFFFQFVGFLLTYLLHTSHAAKYGSRAGLGLTLIQFGFYSHVAQSQDGTTTNNDSIASITGFARSDDGSATPTQPVDDGSLPVVTPRDWLSFLMMTLGWFILLSSIIGFWRVKRWERSIRAASQPPQPVTQEDLERDLAIRRNLYSVFGFGLPEEDIQAANTPAAANAGTSHEDENGNVIVIPSQEALEEARLARDLRAAGLI